MRHPDTITTQPRPVLERLIVAAAGRKANATATLLVLAELVAMERRIFAKADSWVGVFEREVAKPNSLLLLARDPSSLKVVAYAVFTLVGLNAHLSKVAVHEDWRRRGVATMLLREGLKIALAERRSCSSSLHVAVDNPAAVALYRALGYEEDALLEDYYRPGRHAYKMLCDLHLSERFLEFMATPADEAAGGCVAAQGRERALA